MKDAQHNLHLAIDALDKHRNELALTYIKVAVKHIKPLIEVGA